ncbi:hypothetical protein VTJ83DRAFT_6994 [Remersonia thermophila]|uniref:Ankyrin repeat protein n=1 Tax=Remersonia thermophila TaxID=72144 RepID=A0ABR4D3B3_9PEZI
MGEFTTLPLTPHVRRAPRHFRSRKFQEDFTDNFAWSHRASALRKRLHETECRVLLNSRISLPGIRVHGCACRCASGLPEREFQDALLAAKIAAYAEEYLASQPPSPSSTLIKGLSASRTKPVTQNSPRSRSWSSSAFSTLSRLVSAALLPAPALFPPSTQLQDDLVTACSKLNIDKVAQYISPSICAHTADREGRLLSPQLPVNMPNYLGVTPLMAAVRSPTGRSRPTAHLEMIKFLVDCCGADVNAARMERMTGLGESVLSIACSVGAVEVVKFLISRNVTVDAGLPAGSGSRNGLAIGRGATALHIATLAGHTDCVAVLIKDGKADVNAVCDLAHTTGHGAERDRRTSLGRGKASLWGGSARKFRHPVTPLHLARGSVECARVLLDNGADLSATDGYGRTPLDWAILGGHASVVDLLASVQDRKTSRSHNLLSVDDRN